MIWIVSSSIAGTEENLSARHEYIEMVSQARVSPWQKRTAMIADKRYLNYYQCKSEKGEYGLFVSAHTPEVAKCDLKLEKGDLCYKLVPDF